MEATKSIDMDGILTKNSFRYRGYYYDAETRFYYLASHYYELVRSAVYTGAATTQTPESRMQSTYTKGGNIGTLSYRETDDTATRTYTYEYATDDKPTKATLPDKSTLAYSYDSLRRPSKTVYTPKSGATDTKKLYTTLQYQPSQFTVDGKTRKTTTDLVSTYTNRFGSSGTPVSEFTYTYDAWGNITAIKDQSGRQKTYTYNEYESSQKPPRPTQTPLPPPTLIPMTTAATFSPRPEKTPAIPTPTTRYGKTNSPPTTARPSPTTPWDAPRTIWAGP